MLVGEAGRATSVVQATSVDPATSVDQATAVDQATEVDQATAVDQAMVAVQAMLVVHAEAALVGNKCAFEKLCHRAALVATIMALQAVALHQCLDRMGMVVA